MGKADVLRSGGLSTAEISRRELLRKGVMAGGLAGAAWVAPSLTTLGPHAFAATGTPVPGAVSWVMVWYVQEVEVDFENAASSSEDDDAAAEENGDVETTDGLEGVDPAGEQVDGAEGQGDSSDTEPEEPEVTEEPEEPEVLEDPEEPEEPEEPEVLEEPEEPEVLEEPELPNTMTVTRYYLVKYESSDAGGYSQQCSATRQNISNNDPTTCADYFDREQSKISAEWERSWECPAGVKVSSSDGSLVVNIAADSDTKILGWVLHDGSCASRGAGPPSGFCRYSGHPYDDDGKRVGPVVGNTAGRFEWTRCG
jgi:hypothetical protein